jgi:lipopolysaccharide transport system permease protein
MPNNSSDTLIVAGKPDSAYWADLWHYRELLGFLAWRDIKVRYKQATLGIVWAVVQPMVTMAIFTFVFGRLAKMPNDLTPYPLVVLAGLLPWQLFSSAFSGASSSLLSNASLVSKVYFPRLIIPLSALAVALVDFCVVLVLYAVLMLWYGVLPAWHVVFLPLFILLAILAAFGAGAWLSALTVKYRDFRFIAPFMLQVGVFLSPVGFRTDNLPNWRMLMALNPLTGVIDGFRWCLLGKSASLDSGVTLVSVTLIAVILATGIWYFRRTERSLADDI